MDLSQNFETTTNGPSTSKKVVKADLPKTTVKVLRPSVFSYSDYRTFLKDAYEYKKSLNPQFSENAFVLAAGFGKSSRGYLGLILKGKRNLTSKSIVGFSAAIQLSSKESLFFENLVLFSQAETEKEKIFYFERMKLASHGVKSKFVDVLSSQFRFVNEWHLIVLREIIVLKDFKDDESWIYKKLCGRVSKDKILEGLSDLQNLGLISKNEQGKWIQTDPIVLFKDSKTNFQNSTNLHKQFTQKAGDIIMNEAYEKRAVQLITLTIMPERFEELRAEMQNFTKMILEKYGSDNNGNNEHIVQLGSQLIYTTNI